MSEAPPPEVPRPVHIHYLRPPDREEVFHQLLLLDTDRVKVTLARAVEFDPPLRIGGDVVLETGSDVVWFTFPGAWHDIGRFHRPDDTFTGIYANILTPPDFHPGGIWRTTDLFLDVWLPPGGAPEILDEEQLEEAVERGWVDRETARRAREEARRLTAGAERGEWPPRVVAEWDLDRARRAAAAG